MSSKKYGGDVINHKEIMERVAVGREREAADRLARDINAEIEAIILGAKKVTKS